MLDNNDFLEYNTLLDNFDLGGMSMTDIEILAAKLKKSAAFAKKELKSACRKVKSEKEKLSCCSCSLDEIIDIVNKMYQI